MSAKKPSGVDEKIEQLGGVAQDVLEGAKESIARAEGSMEKAKELLGARAGKLKAASSEAYGKAKVYLTDARAALETARQLRLQEAEARAKFAKDTADAAKVMFEDGRGDYQSFQQAQLALLSAQRANDGIVIIQDDAVRFANNRFAQMLGCSVQEVAGKAGTLRSSRNRSGRFLLSKRPISTFHE
jgi:PAS domain-containing protein